MNYYNEFDPKAAAWLRELIKAGLIPPGDVDERNIKDVRSTDLSGYVQHHFFAGIGGWSHALAIARWSDDRAVWTGSCPCQPFSAAGKQKGEADARHLWPEFFRLIRECAPAIVFGEQVASALGRGWLAGVRADLEGVGYEVGAADLCAAGIGAPHIRQRLFWVANADRQRRGEGNRGERFAGQSATWRAGGIGRLAVAGCEPSGRGDHGPRESAAANQPWTPDITGGSSGARRVGDASGPGLEERESDRAIQRAEGCSCARQTSELRGNSGGMVDTFSERIGGRDKRRFGTPGQQVGQSQDGPGTTDEFGDGCEDAGTWSNFDLLPCRDGKQRRVESGTFPLAHGVPGRVGLLRGYGNAIVPWLAAEFVGAWLEIICDA